MRRIQVSKITLAVLSSTAQPESVSAAISRDCWTMPQLPPPRPPGEEADREVSGGSGPCQYLGERGHQRCVPCPSFAGPVWVNAHSMK
jgi:hypothetical protein